MLDGRQPGRVGNIRGVIADGVFMQDGDPLRRPAFMVQCTGGSEYAGEIRRAVDLPTLCCSLRLDSALKTLKQEGSRIAFCGGVEHPELLEKEVGMIAPGTIHEEREAKR
jgi:hypothetical protein